MATIASLLLQRPQEEEKPLPPVAAPPPNSWVQDLISKRYQPDTQRIKRQPVGFDFKQNPFDPSSYYRALGSFRDVSRNATQIEQVKAQNAAQKEYEAQQAALQNALGGIKPNFTGGPGGGSDGSDFNGKSRKYHLGHVSANTAKQADFLGSKFGIKTIGGYREHGSVPGSDHPKGRATDFMINNIKNGHRTGDSLANYAVQNYKAMNIKYVIWNRYIWTPSQGWHRYNGPSPHTDHVHVSYNK